MELHLEYIKREKWLGKKEGHSYVFQVNQLQES